MQTQHYEERENVNRGRELPSWNKLGSRIPPINANGEVEVGKEFKLLQSKGEVSGGNMRGLEF